MNKSSKFLVIGIALGVVAHILYLNMQAQKNP